jgi:hypothetical protein
MTCFPVFLGWELYLCAAINSTRKSRSQSMPSTCVADLFRKRVWRVHSGIATAVRDVFYIVDKAFTIQAIGVPGIRLCPSARVNRQKKYAAAGASPTARLSANFLGVWAFMNEGQAAFMPKAQCRGIPWWS